MYRSNVLTIFYIYFNNINPNLIYYEFFIYDNF